MSEQLGVVGVSLGADEPAPEGPELTKEDIKALKKAEKKAKKKAAKEGKDKDGRCGRFAHGA